MNLTTTALSVFDHLHRCPSVTVFEAHVAPPRDESAHLRALGRLRFGDEAASRLIASLPEVRLSWGLRGERAVLGSIRLPGADVVVATLLDRSRPASSHAQRGPAGEFALDGLVLDARSIPACAVAIDVFDSGLPSAKGTANLVAVGRRVASPIVMMRGFHPLPSPGFTLGSYLRLTFGTAGLLMLRDVEGGDATALGALMDDSQAGTLLLPIRDLAQLAAGPTRSHRGQSSDRGERDGAGF